MQGTPKGDSDGKVVMAVGDTKPTVKWTTTASPITITPPASFSNTISNITTTIGSTGTTWTNFEPLGFSSPEFDEMKERIGKIEERLAILQPNIELHDKFPALRRAYEEYLILEKLINGSRDNRKCT